MVEIRKLPVSQWRVYRRLRLDSLRESPLAFGSSFGEEASFSEEDWKERMKNTYFAMAGELPVGMVVCSFTKEVKFRHIAEVFGFYVAAGERGKGIGSALLDHALKLAKGNRQIVKVRLYVNERQSAALRMYEKAGFEVVGRLAREMRVRSRFYTMLVMEKKIR